MRDLVLALTTTVVMLTGSAVSAQNTSTPAHAGQSQSEEQITLIGTIQTADGAPLPQATVYLFSRSPSELAMWKKHGDGILKDPATTSDEHGNFTLTADPTYQRRFLYVLAEGYAEAFHPITHPHWTYEVKENTTHTITLHRATSAEGTVFGEDGNPLPGATVSAFPATLTHFLLTNWELSSSLTDGNGRFKLDAMPDTSASLTVTSPGYATEHFVIHPGETPQVRLTRGQTVRGRALDMDDNPVAGIRLVLSAGSNYNTNPSELNPLPFPVSWHQGVFTGDNGEFTFLNVPYGDYRLAVSQEVFHATNQTTQPRNKPPAQHLYVPGGNSNSMPVAVKKRVPQHPLTARVYDGYTIEGQVIDKTTSSPIPGATVYVSGSRIATDHEGRFTVQNLFNTNTQVTVDAPGYLFDPPATFETTHMVNDVPLVKLDRPTSGLTVTAILPMVPDRPITGRVIDAQTSQPIPNALVIPVPTQFFIHTSETTGTKSHDDGTFSIGLKRPGHFPIRADADGYAPGFSSPVQRTTQDEVIIQMHRGVTVRGQVLSPEGQPVAGATVWHLVAFETPDDFPMPLREPLTSTTTNAEGHFVLEEFPPNITTILAASADDFARSIFHEMKVQTDQPADPIVLTLREAVPLAGRLLQADGTPTTKTHIMAYNESGEQEISQTDDQGRFRFKQLPEGTYTIQIIAGRGQAFPGIETGQEDLELILEQ